MSQNVCRGHKQHLGVSYLLAPYRLGGSNSDLAANASTLPAQLNTSFLIIKKWVGENIKCRDSTSYGKLSVVFTLMTWLLKENNSIEHNRYLM